MNVFDEEMGELISDQEFKRLLLLMLAGLTLEECQAYGEMLKKGRVN